MILTEDDVIQTYMDSDIHTDWLVSEMMIFARAVIAANNAKALEGMKPVAIVKADSSGYLTPAFTEDCPVPYEDDLLYSADQVAPLIQRVKELNDLLAKSLVNNMKLKATS